MDVGNRRPRLAVLTNIMAPYRVPVFRYLGQYFDLRVILSGQEDNRSWGNEGQGPLLDMRTAWGFTIKRSLTHKSGITKKVTYTHINPGYLWELFQFRPDMVISFEMGFRSLVALVYTSLVRKPLWIWWGGTLVTEADIPPIKRWLRWFFARVQRRWISYGQSSTDYLLSLGIARKSILQVQNCVDETRFSPFGPALDLPVPRPRALYVGHLIGLKGIYPLLEAAHTIQQEGHGFSLVVVGDGPERAAFLTQAKELNVNLYHIPNCPNQELPRVYRACDFLVFPTLRDVWGLVVNEAMLCNLPVIASIYAGCTSELVPPEGRFDPQNKETFVAALRNAVRGCLVPPDRSRLRATHEVGQMIADDLRRWARS